MAAILTAHQTGAVIGGVFGSFIGLIAGLSLVFLLLVDPALRLLWLLSSFILGTLLGSLLGYIRGYISDTDMAQSPYAYRG
jgi:hypothetical protein